jgi:hypothetical protein
MSWWFSQRNLVKKTPIKKTNQKYLIEMVKSKSTYPNALWSSWTWGQKDNMGNFFDKKFQ